MIKEICGIEALNDFLFSTKKEAKVVSMDTLVRIAEDNGIKLYPLELSQQELSQFDFPYILYHELDYGNGEGHFSLVLDKTMLDSVHLEDKVHILVDKIKDTQGGYVIRNEFSKTLKGSKKKTFFGGMFRKPQNILPQIGLGMIPGVGPLLAAGYGAYRGQREAKRAGTSRLMGGVTGGVGGYGLGGLGAGFKGGFTGTEGFLKGFGAGVKGYGGTTGTLLGKLPGFGEGGAISGMLPQGAQSYLGYTPPAGIPQIAGAGIASLRQPLLAGGYGSVTPASMFPQATAAMGGAGAPAGAAGIGAGIAGAGQVATEAAKKSMLQRFAPYLGTALLAGSTGVPSPAYPELPDIGVAGERTRRLLGEMPGGELRTAAQERLLEQIRAPLGTMLGPDVDPYSKEAIRLHTEAYGKRKEEIDQMFNYHGAFGSGEHRQALLDLEEEKARGISQLEQESLYRAQQLELDIRMTSLATALGVSESDARTLMAMLQEEAAREMGIYQEEAAGAGGLQDILGEAGGKLLSRSIMPQQQNILDVILGRGYQSLLAGGQ